MSLDEPDTRRAALCFELGMNASLRVERAILRKGCLNLLCSVSLFIKLSPGCCLAVTPSGWRMVYCSAWMPYSTCHGHKCQPNRPSALLPSLAHSAPRPALAHSACKLSPALLSPSPPLYLPQHLHAGKIEAPAFSHPSALDWALRKIDRGAGRAAIHQGGPDVAGPSCRRHS